jgi:hypothetical protein
MHHQRTDHRSCHCRRSHHCRRHSLSRWCLRRQNGVTGRIPPRKRQPRRRRRCSHRMPIVSSTRRKVISRPKVICFVEPNLQRYSGLWDVYILCVDFR